jgi:hypothetical protein
VRETLAWVLLVVAWWALNAWVLPRLGVGT